MIVRPGLWSEQTEHFIALALATASIDDIKIQVERCGARLFELVTDDGDLIGAFVLRIDHVDGKNQGVIVAAAALAGGVDMTASVLPGIEKMFIGCASVRIHTERVGLAKKLHFQGYKTAELVLTKDL